MLSPIGSCRSAQRFCLLCLDSIEASPCAQKGVSPSVFVMVCYHSFGKPLAISCKGIHCRNARSFELLKSIQRTALKDLGRISDVVHRPNRRRRYRVCIGIIVIGNAVYRTPVVGFFLHKFYAGIKRR